MVINIGKLLDGEYADVLKDILAVVQSAKQHRQHVAVVKVSMLPPPPPPPPPFPPRPPALGCI